MTSSIFNNLMTVLPTLSERHSPKSETYKFLAEVAKKEAKELFSQKEASGVNVEPFGKIRLPYYKMGAVDSVDLWGLDELILFSFYYRNKDRYKRVFDIGANIGLHSIILSKCGYEVTCFEPDPVHYDLLKKNLDYNSCKNVNAEKAAVSNEDGTQEFVRVVGNTTSSHLAGAKDNAYGPTDKFSVTTVDIAKRSKDVDLLKIDAEGHEASILEAIPNEDYERLDVVVEIGSPENAQRVFDKFKGTSANFFAQKDNWERISELKDMPTSYRDGSLFISAKEEMPW